MSKIDSLIESYRRHISMPYRKEKDLTQRTWIAVYPPEDELRLRSKIDEFEIATKDSGHRWQTIDFNHAIADWLDSVPEQKKKECLADDANTTDLANPQFKKYLSNRILSCIQACPVEVVDKTVFAILGAMGIYDFAYISEVFEFLPKNLPGNLLLFFPGEKEENIYKFLNARKGWNYMAVPILAAN
jgi:hypothetical protein